MAILEHLDHITPMKKSKSQQLHFVDLFAGCGGLSLGLEQANFHPVFVNELNSDALKTYTENRKHLEPRLAAEGFHINDVKKMVSGDYLDGLVKRLEENFGLNIAAGELDLVAGGPPCQGFSGIGHRRSYSVDKDQLPSNYLFEDMLFVISKLRPKMFLFENVKGLLSAKWTADGEKGEIWRHIKASFKENLTDYDIDHALVQAKQYGVPQNRPRVLMVGVRKDVGFKLSKDPDAVASGLLPKPTNGAPNPTALLGDLEKWPFENGEKVRTYPAGADNDIQRELRTDPRTRKVRKKGEPVSDHEYSTHAPRVIQKFRHMIKTGGEIPERFATKKFAQRVLPEKWGEEGPTITATSLPDDYVHYSQPRILTVREWARLQMFPDWYEFAGKRTTGGTRRAGNPREHNFDREVPKYTQIGNAVPVGLARAVGKHLAKIVGH